MYFKYIVNLCSCGSSFSFQLQELNFFFVICKHFLVCRPVFVRANEIYFICVWITICILTELKRKQTEWLMMNKTIKRSIAGRLATRRHGEWRHAMLLMMFSWFSHWTQLFGQQGSHQGGRRWAAGRGHCRAYTESQAEASGGKDQTEPFGYDASHVHCFGLFRVNECSRFKAHALVVHTQATGDLYWGVLRSESHQPVGHYSTESKARREDNRTHWHFSCASQGVRRVSLL